MFASDSPHKPLSHAVGCMPGSSVNNMMIDCIDKDHCRKGEGSAWGQIERRRQ